MLFEWFWDYEIILEKHIQIAKSGTPAREEPDGGWIKSLFMDRENKPQRRDLLTVREN